MAGLWSLYEKVLFAVAPWRTPNAPGGSTDCLSVADGLGFTVPHVTRRADFSDDVAAN